MCLSEISLKGKKGGYVITKETQRCTNDMFWMGENQCHPVQSCGQTQKDVQCPHLLGVNWV